MAVSHIKNVTIGDFTGTVTVLNSQAITVTANATDIVRPSDWNSQHNQFLTLSGNTAGSSTVSGTNIVFQGGNNLTLSAATAAGAATIVFSAGAGGGGAAIGVSNTGTTLGNTGTVSSGTVVFAASGNVTASQSTAAGQSTIWFSVPNQSAVPGHALGVSNTGTTLGNTGTNSSGTIVFAASGNITASQSTAAGQSTIWFSVPSQSVQPGMGLGVSNTGTTLGNTGTASSGTIVFAASGQLTASQSTAAGQSTIWFSAPVAAGTGTSVTGLASITLSTNGIQFNGSSLAGVNTGTQSTTGNAALSANSSGITLTMPYRTRFIYPTEQNLSVVSAPGNASISFQYLDVFAPVTATRLDALVSMSFGSAATAATGAVAFSQYAVIYTRNAGTLSSLSSGTTQTTYSYASNSAGQTQLTQAAMRAISVPVNINMAPGEYIVGFNLISATSSIGTATTNYGLTMSMMGGNDLQTVANYAEMGSQTNATIGLYSGMGVYGAASTGLAASYAISSISQTGSSLSQANIAIIMRNA
jgi:filamentous hemagglutinin